MSETVLKEIESRKTNENWGVTLYIFKDKKQLKHYSNQHRSLKQDIVLITISDIERYGLVGYRIKNYKYFEEDV